MIGDIRRFPSTGPGSHSQLGTSTFEAIEEGEDFVRTYPFPNKAKPPSAAGITWSRKDFEKGELITKASKLSH